MLLTGQGLEDSAERIGDPLSYPRVLSMRILEAAALHLGRPELSQKVWDTFDAEDLDEVIDPSSFVDFRRSGRHPMEGGSAGTPIFGSESYSHLLARLEALKRSSREPGS